MKYTAYQQIQRAIMLSAKPELEVTPENVEALWDKEGEDWALQDQIEEFREGGIGTDVTPEWSRHLESRSMARQMDDGSWVGWTFWYGGGKHAEPEAVEWIGKAYYLDVKEEEKLVTIRKFTKKEV